MDTGRDRLRALMRRAALGVVVVLVLTGAEQTLSAEPSAPDERPFVCAQVVIAIDGSGSTRDGAFGRQIRALQSAFRSERLYRAIQDCLPGSMALAVMTWSGPNDQDLCLDWSVVMTEEDAHQVAGLLERCRYFGGTTDIGRAVDHGLRILARSPLVSYYRIVFLLTNGRTDRDAEAALADARARAAGAGITLAAFALLPHRPKHPNPFFVPDAVGLDRYLANHVGAGPRAFTAGSPPETDASNLLRSLVEMLRQEAG